MSKRTMGICIDCPSSEHKEIYTHLNGDVTLGLCQQHNMARRRGSNQTRRFKLMATVLAVLAALEGSSRETEEREEYADIQDALKLRMRSWLGDKSAMVGQRSSPGGEKKVLTPEADHAHEPGPAMPDTKSRTMSQKHRLNISMGLKARAAAKRAEAAIGCGSAAQFPSTTEGPTTACQRTPDCAPEASVDEKAIQQTALASGSYAKHAKASS